MNDRPANDLDLPPEVTRFLARAVLLYGVPFHYLVPDESMLPTESVRFFFLDPAWIVTMIQGATSVGREGASDTSLDIKLREYALSQAMVHAAGVREKGKAAIEPSVTEAKWPLTGFLLRSDVVEGWQGIEMHALDAENQELAPLRIDRLAPDIMLCIFNGEVATLKVKQPPEGLHFGAASDGEGGYQRLSLRNVKTTRNEVRPGQQISKDLLKPPLKIPLRNPVAPDRNPTRVLRVADLAADLATHLTPKPFAVDRFTSAEFGVEMVESPGRVTFSSKVIAP